MTNTLSVLAKDTKRLLRFFFEGVATEAILQAASTSSDPVAVSASSVHVPAPFSSDFPPPVAVRATPIRKNLNPLVLHLRI